jgi:hypothetical protein
MSNDPPAPTPNEHSEIERRDDRVRRLRVFLEQHAWPLVASAAGQPHQSRKDHESILGYGPDGV